MFVNSIMLSTKMKTLLKISLLVAAMATTSQLLAAPAKTTKTNTANAVWATGGNWTNGAPDASKDNITIQHNASSASGLTFGANVTLLVKNGFTLTINGNTTFSNGAEVTVEAGGFLVINGSLTNNNNSDEIAIEGALTVNGAFTGGNGSTITGGGTMTATTITTTGSGAVFGSTDECTGGCSATTGEGVIALPVELVAYDATQFEDEVQIEWATASELNNDGFELEFSTDGVNYEVIAWVGGNGTTSVEQTYLWSGQVTTGYYRLVQYDYDGTRTELDQEFIFAAKAGNIAMFATPNVQGTINVQASKSETMDVTLSDMNGRVVYQGTFNGQGTISANDYPKGIYVIAMSAATKRQVQKIYIQ